jgi:hypothetical protein
MHGMVPVPWRQRFVVGQQLEHHIELFIQIPAVLPSLLAPVVPSERARMVNPPH